MFDYEIEKEQERFNELERIVRGLEDGETINALFAIYNNPKDAEHFKPILEDYFIEQHQLSSKRLEALRKA